MRLAVTGHRGLTEATQRLVDAGLRRIIAEYAEGDLVGLSCIADGADSIFAQAILDAGATLVVIVPAAKYRAGLPKAHYPVYDKLFNRAADVICLDYVESTPESYMAASIRMLENADMLLAVWDGMPARGYGGTADVVQAARERNVPVTIVWPSGAARN